MSGLVVITDSDLPSPGIEEAVLEQAGLSVRREACRSEDDVIRRGVDADALIVQWAPVTGRVLDALRGVRMISRLGIGYDMIDVEAATARGIAVANTPDYCVEEVTTHTLALVLACARGVVALDRAVRSGRWAAVDGYPEAMRPSLTTAGVIGFGRIGARVAAGLRSLGFGVVVHDPYVPAGLIEESGHTVATLEELLAASHVVSLHAPLTERTHHLIGRAAIARMRSGAYLVNTCRGGLVDEAALVEALQAGHLAGAALDVFESEPLPAGSPLRSLPQVVMTPHAAWYSRASLADLPAIAARQVVDFLTGRPVPSIVNPGYSQAARAAG